MRVLTSAWSGWGCEAHRMPGWGQPPTLSRLWQQGMQRSICASTHHTEGHATRTKNDPYMSTSQTGQLDMPLHTVRLLDCYVLRI